MFLLNNNAHSKLFVALSNAATVLTVNSGDGANFPQTVAVTDYFMLTVEDLTQTPFQREIVKVTSRTGNNFTVVRAQENSAAQAFNVGATVSNRITAGTILALYNTAGYSSQMYLGAFAAAPSTTNSGQSLVAGLLYYNTTNNTLYEYESGWQAIGTGGASFGSGVYIGQYANAPTTRADGTALQNGDLYYNITTSQLYDYVLDMWVAASASTTVQGNTTVAGSLTVDGDISATGTVVAAELDASTGTVTTWDVTSVLTVGSESNAGTILFNGLPVVDAQDLSGTQNSQMWPNGNMEYWDHGSTDASGIVRITYAQPFLSATTNVQLTIIGTGGAILLEASAYTTEGFTVKSYYTDGTTYVPAAFFWCAKGN